MIIIDLFMRMNGPVTVRTLGHMKAILLDYYELAFAEVQSCFTTTAFEHDIVSILFASHALLATE